MPKGYADYYLGFGFVLFLRVKQAHACSQNWGLPSLSQLSKGAMKSLSILPEAIHAFTNTVTTRV